MEKRITRYIEFVLGVFIAALAYNLFMLPTNLIYGIGGIAIMINKLYHIDINAFIWVCSIILLVISYIFLGKKESNQSLVGSLLYPLFVYLTSLFMPYISFDVEPIVSVVSGAVMVGVGSGLVMKAGFTTGGTDILNQIVAKYGKKSLGTAMLLSDGLITVCSLFTLGISSFIYSIISIYIISIVVDKVLLGISDSKAFYVITDSETTVKKFIMNEIGHGVTVLDGRGGYTGDNKKVIMCIIPTKDYVEVKEGILNIDKNALLLIADTYEVYNGN